MVVWIPWTSGRGVLRNYQTSVASVSIQVCVRLPRQAFQFLVSKVQMQERIERLRRVTAKRVFDRLSQRKYGPPTTNFDPGKYVQIRIVT